MSQIVNPAGASAPGSANAATATLDFGFAGGPGEGDFASVTVSASWVASGTKLVATLFGSTANHDVEDSLIEHIEVKCTNIVAGVSFDVIGHAPNGTWGQYTVHIIGV